MTIIHSRKHSACLHSASVFWLLLGSLQINEQEISGNKNKVQNMRQPRKRQIHEIGFENEAARRFRKQNTAAGNLLMGLSSHMSSREMAMLLPTPLNTRSGHGVMMVMMVLVVTMMMTMATLRCHLGV